MNFLALASRLQQPDCLELSNQEAADKLNAKTITETYSRFGSFRTLASLLTAEELLVAVSADKPMVSDMIGFLNMPGDEAGNGGGIDFGNAATIALIESLFTGDNAAIGETIKAYAKRSVSWADQNGWPFIGPHHVAAARGAK